MNHTNRKQFLLLGVPFFLIIPLLSNGSLVSTINPIVGSVLILSLILFFNYILMKRLIDSNIKPSWLLMHITGVGSLVLTIIASVKKSVSEDNNPVKQKYNNMNIFWKNYIGIHFVLFIVLPFIAFFMFFILIEVLNIF